MGFGIATIAPIGFVNSQGEIDWAGFREELRGMLLTECRGRFNGLSTDDIAERYFGRRDLEACIKVENELQLARAILVKRGIVLKNTNYRWHIIDEQVEAYSYIRNRTMRIVNAHQRTRAVANIVQKQYPELSETATVKALAGMQKPVDRLKQAVSKDDVKQLPAPKED